MSGALIAGATTTIPHLIGGSTVTTFPSGFSSSGGSIIQGSGSSSVSTNAGLDVASLVGIFVDGIGLVVQLFLVGVVVITVVSNRAEPDPSGRRPQSVYFFGVSFVTVLLSVMGSTSIVVALTEFIGTHHQPVGNDIAKVVVLGGLLTIISLSLLFTHLRRGLGLALADQTPAGPSRRLGQTYVSAITFLMVLLFLFAAVFAIYLLFALAGPRVFGSFGGRSAALRYLIDAVFIAVVAFLVITTHRGLMPPGLHVFGGPNTGLPPGQYPPAGPSPGPGPAGPPPGPLAPGPPVGPRPGVPGPPPGPTGLPQAGFPATGPGPSAPPGQSAGPSLTTRPPGAPYPTTGPPSASPPAPV